MSDVPPPPADGRSIRWRLGALLTGLAFGAAAVGLWFHPEYLSYAVAAGFASVAMLAVASAIFAKGR